MATLEELYNAIISDEARGKAFTQASGDAEALAAFLKEHGCDAAPEQAKAFFSEKLSKTGELSDTELSSVSGGCGDDSEDRAYCPSCGSHDVVVDKAAQTLDCNSCGYGCRYGGIKML